MLLIIFALMMLIAIAIAASVLVLNDAGVSKGSVVVLCGSFILEAAEFRVRCWLSGCTRKNQGRQDMNE